MDMEDTIICLTAADRGEIARAAYLLWQKHGWLAGNGRDYWFLAGRPTFPRPPGAAQPSKAAQRRSQLVRRLFR